MPVNAGHQTKRVGAAKPLDLQLIEHKYDPERDPDVPIYTDVTLPGVTPDLIDERGRRYALITLYNVDSPLSDLPSEEPGVDRGIDFRDPSNLLKSAYSNYVSPVFTDDRERRPVPGHPIGHFFVKVEIPGLPAVLTGMTTIVRADEELVDLTLDRQLGIGGVLLTWQPGRLNSSAEVVEELRLRQRKLVVIDGLNYRREGEGNVGPVISIEDGNVVFVRFRLPVENALDALNVFLEFVDRGVHNRFGSLLSRPNRATGAGCSAFAMMWLKASGIIPVVNDLKIDEHLGANSGGHPPFWANFYRRLEIPWDRIGCDDRVGLAGSPDPAKYTVYDDLFHDLSRERIAAASEGLAAKVREGSGAVAGTLFYYGALTPLRDLVVRAKRNDPRDAGQYEWAARGQGLPIGFWDNGRFSAWVKSFWNSNARGDALAKQGIRRVREGRFLGVEINATDTKRVSSAFFRDADELARRRVSLTRSGVIARTCRNVFLDFALE